MNNNAGVYKIINMVNENTYIGSSINIYRRLREHKWMLKKGNHTNQHVQHAWDLYGEDKFIFEVLLICDRRDTVMYEQIAIDAIKPEYNIAKYTRAPNLGLNHSEETKKKISESKRGLKHSKETRRKISEALSGINNPNYGKHLSSKVKQKLSIANSGGNCSIETRRKMSVTMIGNTNLLGHNHSEETKKKISESLKRYHEKKRERVRPTKHRWQLGRSRKRVAG